MGKASRKIVKKQLEGKTAVQQFKIENLKAKIAECKENGKQEEELAFIVELLQLQCCDTDIIFDAAQLYFMAGDYEQSAIWINKTLELVPDHLEARILLTRICILGDRIRDGLAVLDCILKRDQDLSEKQKDQMKEILAYSEQTRNTNELLQDYSHVAAFWEAMQVAPPPSLSPFAEVKDTLLEVVKAGTAGVVITKGHAEAIKSEIMTKNISLQGKIELCNSIAGEYCYAGQLADAEMMLLAAFSLDECNMETLRNLSLLMLVCDDKNRALQYAEKIPQKDFILLQLIKKHVLQSDAAGQFFNAY